MTTVSAGVPNVPLTWEQNFSNFQSLPEKCLEQMGLPQYLRHMLAFHCVVLCRVTLQGRRDWNKIFKVMKGKDLQPRLLYPAKLLFRIEGQIMSFPDKVKPKEFIITKPFLNEMLKGLI